MYSAHGKNAGIHIGNTVRIRLMEHTFIACAGGARLARINTRDNDDLILHFLLHPGKAADVIEHALLLIGGARADDKQEFTAFSLQNFCDLCVSLRFDRSAFFTEGIKLLYLLGDRQFPYKMHIFHRFIFYDFHIDILSCIHTTMPHSGIRRYKYFNS